MNQFRYVPDFCVHFLPVLAQEAALLACNSPIVVLSCVIAPPWIIFIVSVYSASRSTRKDIAGYLEQVRIVVIPSRLTFFVTVKAPSP